MSQSYSDHMEMISFENMNEKHVSTIHDLCIPGYRGGNGRASERECPSTRGIMAELWEVGNGRAIGVVMAELAGQ
jgi:hypothetical protein